MKPQWMTVRSVALLAGLWALPVFAAEAKSVAFELENGAVAEEEDVPAVEDPNSVAFEAPKPVAILKPEKAPKPVKQAKQQPIEAPPREIPLIETQNETFAAPEVSYVTGGIGEDERSAIEAAKADYNLYVMSASVDGAFVGDARVVIRHAEGKDQSPVLSVVSGPLLYVKLPAGKYVMDANIGEQSKHYQLTIGKKPSRIHLGWRTTAPAPTH